jgi:hypothetical protein
MTPLKQLDYVEKYLLKAKESAGLSNQSLSAGQLYTLVFLPARIDKEVVATKGENYYAQNSGLDKDGDGRITQTELASQVKSHYVSDDSFMA